MRKLSDWREMLRPGDWVVLADNREAVILSQREEAYWVEVEKADKEQRYLMVSANDIRGISKNLRHWVKAV